MRTLFDDWQSDDAMRMQTEISTLRKTIEIFPVIPLLKAVLAHYRKDNQWRELRPPLEMLSDADSQRAITMLMEDHNFKLDFEFTV